MAQVCGGSNFDLAASRQHDAALRVVVRVADTLAVHGRESVDLDRFLAVLLRIYLSRWTEFGETRLETRRIDDWFLRVGTSTWVAESLASQYPVLGGLLPAMRAELTCAAEQWLLGDPEQPPTEHALNVLEHILFTHRLIRRPPAARWPATLLGTPTPPPLTEHARR